MYAIRSYYGLQQFQIHFPVRKGLFRREVDRVRAVDGVDLEIPRGQILALVGESGSGKTTLGRGILRLIEPTGGQVAFEETDITRLDRSALRRFRRHMQIIVITSYSIHYTKLYEVRGSVSGPTCWRVTVPPP